MHIYVHTHMHIVYGVFLFVNYMYVFINYMYVFVYSSDCHYNDIITCLLYLYIVFKMIVCVFIYSMYLYSVFTHYIEHIIFVFMYIHIHIYMYI